MLEDPRFNFAISSRGHPVGVNHFGFQVASGEKLETIKQQAQEASNSTLRDKDEAACCYAKSEKHWALDPQDLAWEHFRTMAEARELGQDSNAQQKLAACQECLWRKRRDKPKLAVFPKKRLAVLLGREIAVNKKTTAAPTASTMEAAAVYREFRQGLLAFLRGKVDDTTVAEDLLQ